MIVWLQKPLQPVLRHAQCLCVTFQQSWLKWRLATKISGISFLDKLLKDYRRSTEEAVLRNLIEYAQSAKAQSLRLEDEEWVVDASNKILDMAYQNLIRSVRSDYDQLVESYSGVSSAPVRHDILRWMTAEARAITDPEKIREWLRFAEWSIA